MLDDASNVYKYMSVHVYMALDWQRQRTAFSKRGSWREGLSIQEESDGRAVLKQRPPRLRTEDFVGLSK